MKNLGGDENDFALDFETLNLSDNILFDDSRYTNPAE
jgi:hypothetical protein